MIGAVLFNRNYVC